jgi:small subunit ribosomal protein S17
MARNLIGTVVSTKMQNTAIVEVTRRVAHPLYKKLMKRSKKFKVALNGNVVEKGQNVQISETKKVSKDKYFKIEKILDVQNGKNGKVKK